MVISIYLRKYHKDVTSAYARLCIPAQVDAFITIEMINSSEILSYWPSCKYYTKIDKNIRILVKLQFSDGASKLAVRHERQGN